MTKADLVEELARVVALPRKQADSILDIVLGSMASALREGNKVEIRRFGSLGTRQRQGRIVRNPKSGRRVEVAPHRVPFFKPGKALQEVLNREPSPDLQVSREAAAGAPSMRERGLSPAI